MDIKVNGRGLGGSVRAIPSKSQAHRLLICAALADKPGKIRCPAVNEDIIATARCLSSLGAKIERSGDSFHVQPISKAARAELDCGESGSTLRFLLPVACALGADATFTGHGRLPDRPMAELCGALRSGGANVSADRLPVSVSGGLKAGTYRLPSKVSSQYISGLLFALPLTDGDCTVELDGRPESEPYIDMTVSALEAFGISVIRRDTSYEISGGQRYRSPGEVFVEGDWSNAAFWLCAGAIGSGDLRCTGLDAASRQGDKAVAGLLRRFGADVREKNGEVTVRPSRLHGIEIDAGDIPDLVPVLAVTAAAAEGDTRIYNAGRLRLKESDRIASTAALLRALGANADETDDGLVIHGGGLHGGTVDSFGDHRIAMAAATAACACGDVEIIGAEAVNKSYPGFFEDFMALGGAVK